MSFTAVLLFLAGVVLGLILGALCWWLWSRATVAQARAELTGVLAERDAERRHAQALVADRDAMADRFKALSAETLDRQGRATDAEARSRLRETQTMLDPVREALLRLDERLGEVERERTAMRAELRAQINTVMLTGDGIRRETQALTTALRKPQVRGAWGEMQLKRVAEITGMLERCDFDTQVVLDGPTGPLRPDMRVNLPDGKVIFVDSKAPLSHFLDACETDSDVEREAHMAAFARNVRTHVEQLSGKNYWQLDAGSPEMVVLFLPSDAFLQAALTEQPTLQEYASARGIVFATPSILIPLLKVVQHGWRQAALAENAAEVVRLGKELYERLGTLGGHVDRLGKALTKAVDAYNSTLGSIDSRVMPAARRFGELLVTDHELPRASMIDAATRPVTAAELADVGHGRGEPETEGGATMAR